jgi:hypothetical protein
MAPRDVVQSTPNRTSGCPIPAACDPMPCGDRRARPDRPHALTCIAPPNTAMHHANTALGFRVVEHLYEVEAVIA